MALRVLFQRRQPVLPVHRRPSAASPIALDLVVFIFAAAMAIASTVAAVVLGVSEPS